MNNSAKLVTRFRELERLVGLTLIQNSSISNDFFDDEVLDVAVDLEIGMRSLFLGCRTLLKISLSIEDTYSGYLDVLDVNLDNEGGNSSRIRECVEFLIGELSSSKRNSDEVRIINSQMYELASQLSKFLIVSKEKIASTAYKRILEVANELGFRKSFRADKFIIDDKVISYSQEAYNQLESQLEAARQIESEFKSLIGKVRAQFDVVMEQSREVNEYKERIAILFEISEENSKDAKQKIADIALRMTDLDVARADAFNGFESLKKTMALSDSSISELVKSAESINERLKQLLDPSVALDLLSTFKRRKKWLFISTIIWAVLGLASAITLGWQTSVLLTAPGDLSLERTLSISLRILPFIVLLFFCLRQFTKNRNLEEEYAFRESIATSMMSYVDKIEGDTKLKEELIRDTVLKLYTSPLAKITEASQVSSESRQSETLIQSIADLMKQTASAVKKGD